MLYNTRISLKKEKLSGDSVFMQSLSIAWHGYWRLAKFPTHKILSNDRNKCPRIIDKYRTNFKEVLYYPGFHYEQQFKPTDKIK